MVQLVDDEVVINTPLFEEFNRLREHVVTGHEPSLYIYMKVDPSEGMRRRALARDQEMNHFDLASLQEQRRRAVSYERFFWSVSSLGTRVVIIDANRAQNEVLQEVLAVVEEELSQSGGR